MMDNGVSEDWLEKIEELTKTTPDTESFLAACLRQLDYDLDREVFNRLYKHVLSLRESPSWKGFWRSCVSAPASNWRVFVPLSEMIASKDEVVWFLVDLPLLSYWPVFEGKIETVEAITSQCRLLEYYVISQELAWVIAKSRHDEIFTDGVVVKQTKSS
ncbi:MAG: DUF6756 family protein [Chloroflexota bacterium]